MILTQVEKIMEESDASIKSHNTVEKSTNNLKSHGIL